jgi:N-formylglutamate amidohydrolase
MLARRTLLQMPLLGVGTALAETPEPWVLSVRGTLPLVLTAPHGGQERVNGVPPRTRGTTARDEGTHVLAEQVATKLSHHLGASPSLVVARFSRQYIDANRPPDEAYEVPAAQAAYNLYHAEIAKHVAALRHTHTHALLLDIHGQSQVPNTTFRGTRTGLTTRRLLDRAGVAALQGPNSLLGALATQGLQVHPPLGAATLKEDPRYAGGYTVHRYGSHNPDGIDAIQLEFGRQQRENPQLAGHLTEALARFLTHHGYLT